MDVLPCTRRRSACVARAAVAACAVLPIGAGLLYAPPSGSIWDPSCIRVGGKTHCVAMHVGTNQTLDSEHGGYPYGLLYTADDGVHFETVGTVAPERWPSIGFFKAVLSYVGPDPENKSMPLFIMNHGTEGSSQHPNEPPPSAGKATRAEPRRFGHRYGDGVLPR
eukprot:SAG31_NODE_5273_length_2639_cov_1.587795_3_plen_165_part_00